MIFRYDGQDPFEYQQSILINNEYSGYSLTIVGLTY